MRYHMIDKLVQTMIANSDAIHLEDMTVRNVYTYCFALEADIYGRAQSLVQYHHMFGQKLSRFETNGVQLNQLNNWFNNHINDVTNGFNYLILDAMVKQEVDDKPNSEQ